MFHGKCQPILNFLGNKEKMLQNMLLKRSFLIRGLEVKEIIPFPVWIIPFPVLKINFELLD